MLSPPPLLPEPRRQWVSNRNCRIAVSTWGRPDLSAVILLHGMRDHARNWDWTAAALADRYHLIAPDLRGHGDSDRAGSYNLAGHVSDLAAVADAFGLKQFTLVCHSFGSAIGLRYAAAFPERVATLCGIECRALSLNLLPRDTDKGYPQLLREWIGRQGENERRLPRRYASMAEAVERVAEQNPALDSETVAHLTRHAVIAQGDGMLRWKYDPAARTRLPEDVYGRELDAVLAALECPVWILHGEASWLPLPPQNRLRLIRFPGAGHWLHHEQRDRFLAMLCDFLSEHRKEPLHA